MTKPVRIDVNSLKATDKPFTGNVYDAIPTMSYAITAYKRAGGQTDNKYFQSYAKAMSHFAQVYGREAADHLQEVAVNAGGNDGDLNDALKSYAKNAIDTKKPVHPIVNNLLSMADDGQKPLEKWQYAFDIPEKTDVVMNSIKSKLKR